MSNYRNKKNGQRSKPAPRKLDAPVYDYTSVCHDALAKKRPCVVDAGTQFSDRNKLEHSLGTWNCTVCRKKCKVTRKLHKKEEVVEAAA